jgi:hypothetical protein
MGFKEESRTLGDHNVGPQLSSGSSLLTGVDHDKYDGPTPAGLLEGTENSRILEASRVRERDD